MDKVIVNLGFFIMLSSCSGYTLIDPNTADDAFINQQPDMYQQNFPSDLNRKEHTAVSQPLADGAHPRGNRNKEDYIECSETSSVVHVTEVFNEGNDITYWPNMIKNVTCQVLTASKRSCFPDMPSKNRCYVYNAKICQTNYKLKTVFRYQNGKYLNYDSIEVGVGCKCNIIHKWSNLSG